MTCEMRFEVAVSMQAWIVDLTSCEDIVGVSLGDVAGVEVNVFRMEKLRALWTLLSSWCLCFCITSFQIDVTAVIPTFTRS